MDQQTKILEAALAERERLKEELITVYLRLEKLPSDSLKLLWFPHTAGKESQPSCQDQDSRPQHQKCVLPYWPLRSTRPEMEIKKHKESTINSQTHQMFCA
eukprot:5384714-Amphidinium_carterae.1